MLQFLAVITQKPGVLYVVRLNKPSNPHLAVRFEGFLQNEPPSQQDRRKVGDSPRKARRQWCVRVCGFERFGRRPTECHVTGQRSAGFATRSAGGLLQPRSRPTGAAQLDPRRRQQRPDPPLRRAVCVGQPERHSETAEGKRSLKSCW